MISIELDSRSVGDAAGSMAPEDVQALAALLDRCDEENLRDVVLRFPAACSEEFAVALRPLLARPFRFSAWFRALPPAMLDRKSVV